MTGHLWAVDTTDKCLHVVCVLQELKLGQPGEDILVNFPTPVVVEPQNFQVFVVPEQRGR